MSALFSKNSSLMACLSNSKNANSMSRKSATWDLSSLQKVFPWTPLAYPPSPIGQFPVLSPIFKFFLDSPISTVVLLMATLVWSCLLLPFFGQRETPHSNGLLLHRKHLIT